MEAFRLVLRLHTPVIMPRVAPRLDSILAEAVKRRDQNWHQVPDLPLVFDADIDGYRCSQVVFLITPTTTLSGVTVTLTDHLDGLDLMRATDARRLLVTGGAHKRRFSQHAAYVSPYLAFDGEGDVDEVIGLLDFIDGIGLECGRGTGSFDVDGVLPPVSEGWRYRPLPEHTPHVPFDPIPDRLRTKPGGVDVPVVRPPRILKNMIR